MTAMTTALEETAKLKRMTWTQLVNYALRNDLVSLGACQWARTRDELRLAILEAQFPATEEVA